MNYQVELLSQPSDESLDISDLLIGETGVIVKTRSLSMPIGAPVIRGREELILPGEGMWLSMSAWSDYRVRRLRKGESVVIRCL